MSDIIREVNEELRREQLLRFWQRYGGYIAAAAFLMVAATAGWRAYDWYAGRQAERTSVRFDNATKLAADATKAGEAKAALDAVIADSPYGYRVLARFVAATEAGEKNAGEGAAAFDAIAADTSVEQSFRDLARVRAAMLLIDNTGVAEIQKRVEPLLGEGANFRYSAKELLALAHYRAGDRANAQKLFLELAFDPQTPAGVRSRAQVMQSLLAGTPAPAAAPATQ